MDSIDIEKLIAEVFDHPILYDQSLKAYKDNNRKNNVWKKIALSLDATGTYFVSNNKAANMRIAVYPLTLTYGKWQEMWNNNPFPFTAK